MIAALSPRPALRAAVIGAYILLVESMRALAMTIRPDYVGKNVPTSDTERIEVLVEEEDGIDQAVIVVS